MQILKEAKRLHRLGFAIHWLRPKSKVPVEAGWTTGPRKGWQYLKGTYQPGFNVGVRLGAASEIMAHAILRYLAVVDLDVKSTLPHHRKEALAAVKKLLGDLRCPIVMSGRGNGSRHYYCQTKKPFKTFNAAQSTELITVLMPSKKPSKKELQELSEKQIAEGWRISHAWEISLYSEGRQVVLPPSIHPDSGEMYSWYRSIERAEDIPELRIEDLELPTGAELPDDVARARLGSDSSAGVAQSVPGGNKKTERSEGLTLNFSVEPVEFEWLPISKRIREAIVNGTGVTDRSGFLLQASTALISAGLSQNEVLTVLTDPNTFLGAVGYDHAKTKNRSRAAEWIYRYTFKKVAAEREATGVFGKASEAAGRKLSAEEIEKQNSDFKSERHWSQDLVRGGPKGDGPPKALVGNVVLILKNQIGEDLVKRDLFAIRDTYNKKTPWGGRKNEIVTDDDVANIKYWLGQTWRFEPGKEVIFDALTVIACQNSFDPVRDMLEALPAWDGQERLNTWIAKYFEGDGEPEYLAQVFRKWMVAMVMRVYRPGAKFDWMPIFEGNQGIGKSSFGRLLVGDKYFLDWLPNLNDKDSALSLQGMWGVEMGELSQFRKNDLENIKAFISRTVDKLRPPYGRKLMESARRCVFFGTTNRETYLIDETGNRRFKPMMVGNLNFKQLAKDRLQLFAEAKHLFDQKRETELTLELTGKAKEYERKIHLEKMVEDDSNLMRETMVGFIEKFHKNQVEFNFDKFQISDLFKGGGPLGGLWRSDGRNAKFAAKMLRNLGGQKRKVRGNNYWKIEQGDRSEGTTVPLDFF